MGASQMKVAVRTKLQSSDFSGEKPDFDHTRHFVPTKTIAWVIGQSQYDMVRKAGQTQFKDRDQSMQDIGTMVGFYKSIGVNHIYVSENPTGNELTCTWKEKLFESEFEATQNDPTLKLLIYIHYSGHGVIDTQTLIVLNEFESKLRYYNLEQEIADKSALYPNVFFILTLDCCRVNPPQTIFKASPVKTPIRAQKYMESPDKYRPQIVQFENFKKSEQKLYVYYSQHPSNYINLTSTFVKNFKFTFIQTVKQNGGVLVMPDTRFNEILKACEPGFIGRDESVMQVYLDFNTPFRETENTNIIMTTLPKKLRVIQAHVLSPEKKKNWNNNLLDQLKDFSSKKYTWSNLKKRKAHDEVVKGPDAAYCIEKLHECVLQQPIIKQPNCLQCGETKDINYWICKQDECIYSLCTECHSQKGVKCQFGHQILLEIAQSTSIACSMCDNTIHKWPILQCVGYGKSCQFQICFKCYNDNSKIKCERGHPFLQDKKLKLMQTECSYCHKSSSGILSCLKCRLFICVICKNDVTTPLFQGQIYEETFACWEGEHPNKENQKIRFEILIKRNGKVKGKSKDFLLEGQRVQRFIVMRILNQDYEEEVRFEGEFFQGESKVTGFYKAGQFDAVKVTFKKIIVAKIDTGLAENQFLKSKTIRDFKITTPQKAKYHKF